MSNAKTPEQVMVDATATLQHYKAHRDDPWTKAYFDSRDPLHAEAVHYAAILSHLSVHGTVEKFDANPYFDTKAEYEELAREVMSEKLASKGIKVEVPSDPVADADGPFGKPLSKLDGKAETGPRSVADLRKDAAFVKALTDKYSDPAAHTSALAEWTAAHAAAAGGNDAQ